MGSGRRRESEPRLKQLHHAGRIGPQLDVVELLGLLGQADRLIAGALAGGGRKSLGIVGDEVFLNPFRAARLDAEIVEFHLGVVKELLGVVGGGLGLGTAG